LFATGERREIGGQPVLDRLQDIDADCRCVKPRLARQILQIAGEPALRHDLAHLHHRIDRRPRHRARVERALRLGGERQERVEVSLLGCIEAQRRTIDRQLEAPRCEPARGLRTLLPRPLLALHEADIGGDGR
jgi:hypothetical protein